MPNPNKNESQNDYISRCMSSEESKKSFPDQKQRAAFCHSQWQDKGKSSGAVFVYEDPRTGELFHFSRRGIHKKNGRVLVFVKKSKGGLTPQQRTDYIEAIKEHLESDDEKSV